MLAARISLVQPPPEGVGSPPSPLAQGLVRAVWTADLAVSTAMNPQVAHYTGQAELAQVIQQGMNARKSGDAEQATAKLGRAVQLATAWERGRRNCLRRWWTSSMWRQVLCD
ncbi:hypothetical protein SANTM175S_03294 [Streptomyces antimycoticus]